MSMETNARARAFWLLLDAPQSPNGKHAYRRSEILPGQAANAEVRPNLWLAAFSRTAPPSELPVVDQISQQPVDQKYLGRANTLLWYVRSSEGLAFGLKPASITDLYHGEAFRVSKIMNFQGWGQSAMPTARWKTTPARGYVSGCVPSTK
jgi:hypothetical protein